MEKKRKETNADLTDTKPIREEKEEDRKLTLCSVEMIPKGMLWMEKSESGLVSMKDMVD